MKSFSKTLLNFLLSDQVESFYTADLFEIETTFGMKMYATDGQMPITYKGNVYEPVKYGNWRRGTVSTKLGMTSSSMTFSVTADDAAMNGNVVKWPDAKTRVDRIELTTDTSTGPGYYPGILIPGVTGSDQFYLRISGSISPTKTGHYTFSLLTDDETSVYINGNLLGSATYTTYHDNVPPLNPAVFGADLVAGSLYEIVATLDNNLLVHAGLSLRWAPPGEELSIVTPIPGSHFDVEVWKMGGPATQIGLNPPYPINGGEVVVPNDFNVPLMQAIQQGLFDGAKITVYTTYMPDYGDLVYGVETKYSGQITELSKTGRTTAEGTAESYLFKLNQQMPRMLVQPSCRWVFGDAGCTLDTANFTQAGVVSSSSTSLQIIPQTAFTQADGYFTQGVLTMTSGQNMGLSMSVKQYKGGVLVLTRPFLFPIATGDTFQVIAGCDHTYATCQQKFNNLINYGGMPWIPNMERAI